MTSLSAAEPHLKSAPVAERPRRYRRAVAVTGVVCAGLLVLSACEKPTAVATVTVGDESVNSEAVCYQDGKAIKPAEVAECLKDKDVESITVDPDETVRFGVDVGIADKEWTVLLDGQRLTDYTKKTYLAVPGSVFFNEQYGASGGTSTTVSIAQGGENKVTGLWSFRLKKAE
ncbi:DUF2771 domain-containing protein [Streptomyces sp. NPDC127068]|uniref:DUF2771 domain-containing protein n=1 Tax=Streptomyces sp. NPDC127068 TaxID=3347127 RepID=UPI003650493C